MIWKWRRLMWSGELTTYDRLIRKTAPHVQLRLTLLRLGRSFCVPCGMQNCLRIQTAAILHFAALDGIAAKFLFKSFGGRLPPPRSGGGNLPDTTSGQELGLSIQVAINDAAAHAEAMQDTGPGGTA